MENTQEKENERGERHFGGKKQVGEEEEDDERSDGGINEIIKEKKLTRLNKDLKV